MHRFSVLRTLYLIEMMHAKGNIEKEKEIHEKYRIPALVENIDYIKTYSNYLLSVLNISFISSGRISTGVDVPSSFS